MKNEVLNFEPNLSLNINKEFLKECFYERYSLDLEEKVLLLGMKSEVETVIFKAQHILSVINRIETKLL